MTTPVGKCQQCGQPHGNSCYEKLGNVIYWFCSDFCRQWWQRQSN